MDRDQLIDLTRRALKLARDKTTDLTPAEYTVAAADYTSAERLVDDKAMLMASPQLVGYASELPQPANVLHEDGDGPLDPDDTRRRRHGEGLRQCLPAPPVTDRVGLRLRPPALVPVPRMDLRPRRQPGGRSRQGRVSREFLGLTTID